MCDRIAGSIAYSRCTLSICWRLVTKEVTRSCSWTRSIDLIDSFRTPLAFFFRLWPFWVCAIKFFLPREVWIYYLYNIIITNVILPLKHKITTENWKFEFLNFWKFKNLKIWKFEFLKIWKFENSKTWKLKNLNFWKFENLKI